MEDRLPRRIVVFCLPGIGDAILFTPALASLRRAFPSAHITAVTMFDGAADILRTNPNLDEVRCFDFFNAGTRQGIRYVWQLRGERFDLSILGFPANRLEYNVLNALVGRRWRAGHRYKRQPWRNLAVLNNIAVRETGERHNVEENLALVGTICRRVGIAVPAPDTRLAVHLTAADLRQADQFLAEREMSDGDLLIGLHTYSSTFKSMHRKCWDKDKFVGLIERIASAHPRARFLMFSGPSDRAVSEHIVRHAKSRVTMVEEPNIRCALGVLKHCRLFISNDSAIMHLAGALGVPVVALFGPTNWRRLHPWAASYRIVRRELPCMPCFEYSSRPLRCVANLDYACLRDLAVDDVLAAVRGLLAVADASDSPAGH
jgi:ADP-heptose:LPS heptosyltransferase